MRNAVETDTPGAVLTRFIYETHPPTSNDLITQRLGTRILLPARHLTLANSVKDPPSDPCCGPIPSSSFARVLLVMTLWPTTLNLAPGLLSDSSKVIPGRSLLTHTSWLGMAQSPPSTPQTGDSQADLEEESKPQPPRKT